MPFCPAMTLAGENVSPTWALCGGCSGISTSSSSFIDPRTDTVSRKVPSE